MRPRHTHPARSPVPYAVTAIGLVWLLVQTLSGCALEPNPTSGFESPEEDQGEACRTVTAGDRWIDRQEGSERSVSPRSTTGDRRPNVVWIILDACRAGNLSGYGYERNTAPYLAALGERGVTFEQHFAQSNHTLPSVSSYLTGRFFPVLALGDSDWKRLYRTPAPEEQLLPAIMRNNGYHTAIFTSHPYFGPRTRAWRSFDHRVYLPAEDPEAGYADLESLNAAVLPWVRENADVPFFLYLHALDTHLPHHPVPPHDRWLDHPSEWRDNTRPFSAEYREHLRGLHDGSIHFSDTQIGRLFEQLESLGLLDNTVVMVGSDHGDLLGEDGETLGHPVDVTTDELYHVPWIMAGPGLPRGRRVESLTQNVDIVPTLIELLELQTDARTDGKSLSPLLSAAAEPSLHEYVFSTAGDGSDDDPPVLVLRGNDYRYQLDPATGEQHLWRVPDLLVTREDEIAGAPEDAARMRRFVEQKILPRWREYAALDRGSPAEFIVPLPPAAEPQEAYALLGDEHWGSPIDDRWTLREGMLRSCGFAEDAPPITFRLDVPSGRFCVQAALLGAPPGRPYDSAVAIRTTGDPEYRTFRAGSDSIDFSYVELGAYDVDGNGFEITLDEADRQSWALVYGFRFIPTDGPDASLPGGPTDGRLEQLRSLGYVH